MNAQEILKAAAAIQPEIQANRRELHKHPELGLDMVYTKPFVAGKLREMGYEPVDCGEGGLYVTVGGKKGGKCFLIRADMDALPVDEEADVDFKSENPGKMHACGHDTHTAMLLGAAKILKDAEDELEGTVKLMFQPGEETLQGAIAMVEAGVLDGVDAGMMIHAMTGMPMPKGMMVLLDGGSGMASCDQYKITVQGKGGHGAMPHLTIDPITAAAHIHVALAEIHSRELESTTFGVITSGMFHAGVAPNVIADVAEMEGTIRTGDPKVEEMLMTRVREIAETVAKAYRCEAKVEFVKHCPPMIADVAVTEAALSYMQELLGQGAQKMSTLTGSTKVAGGSEDFAFVSAKVPCTAMMLSMAGADSKYPQHHPKAVFEDDVLFHGSAAYAHVAMRWLADNK
ncbi:MAG: amidohydrolase [Clostridia bacterium]|nr:amidohydrolase [Clostridia bacterium]